MEVSKMNNGSRFGGQVDNQSVRQSRFASLIEQVRCVGAFRTLLITLLSGAMCVALTACSPTAGELREAHLRSPIAHIATSASVEQIEAYRKLQLEEMDYADVSFSRLGNTAKLIISTSAVFEDGTSNLSAHATDTHILQRMQAFLSTYDIDRMRITSYRKAVSDDRIDQALTEQQANIVEHVLAHSLFAKKRSRVTRTKGVVWPKSVELADKIEVAFQFYPHE